jgi:hypothetical protein
MLEVLGDHLDCDFFPRVDTRCGMTLGSFEGLDSDSASRYLVGEYSHGSVISDAAWADVGPLS